MNIFCAKQFQLTKKGKKHSSSPEEKALKQCAEIKKKQVNKSGKRFNIFGICFISTEHSNKNNIN